MTKKLMISFFFLCILVLPVMIRMNGINREISISKEMIPDFEFTSTNGGLIKKADLDTNKYTLISFFNSDCDYCISENKVFTDSIRFYEQCRLLLVSWEDSAKVGAFYQQYNLKAYYPNIRVAYVSENHAKELFRIYATPTLYIYNPKQQLLKYKPGPVAFHEIIEYLK